MSGMKKKPASGTETSTGHDRGGARGTAERPARTGLLGLARGNVCGHCGRCGGKSRGEVSPCVPPKRPPPGDRAPPWLLTAGFDHVGLAGAAVEAFVRSLLHLLLGEEAVTRRVQPPAGSGGACHAPRGHREKNAPPATLPEPGGGRAHRSQWRHWMSRSSSTYFWRQKGQTTRLAQGAQWV